MRIGMRVGGLVVAVAIGMLGAGCGGSDSPEDVVNTFFDATADKDAEALCDVISEATAAKAAADEEADTCEEGVTKTFASSGSDETIAKLANAEVGEATIDGDTATVAVTSDGNEGEIALVKEDDEWKVDGSD